MKKFLFLFVCMLWQLGASAQFSGSGNGTAEDPYRIYTDIHLAQMANFLNKDSVVFELMKDIDLTSYISENSPREGWMPIGVEATPFKGTLKGNNHTISGLTIKRTSTDNVGLFGYISGATIQDLIIQASSIYGKTYVGPHVGYAVSSTLKNVKAVVETVEGSNGCTGGIVGYASASTIEDADLEAKLIKTSVNAGGIVGYALNCTINNCSVNSEIKTTSERAGGVAGYMFATNVTNVRVTGNVSGTEAVGGCFGRIGGTCALSNITSIGDIVGSGSVSGIAGDLATSSVITFNSCYSKGEISNTGDYTGGIVGKSNGVCINSMDDCSHFGDIKGKNYVGGLVGAVLRIDAESPKSVYELKSGSSSSSTFYYSFYDNIVTGSTASRNLNNCTAIGNIEGQDYVGGLVGESLYATAYTSANSTYTYSRSSSGNVYLWKNGVYQSNKNYNRYSSGTYYYDFPIITYTKGISTISLVNSYFSGNISAEKYVGGLIGHKVSGDIRNCYTYSTINGQQYVGGIAGQVEGYSTTQLATIKSTVANNASVTATTANVGRIYGAKGNNVTIGNLASQEGNRALTQTSVMLCGEAQDVIDDLQNGTSVGPSMLRLKANYVSWGWDFDTNWNILETECYPYKKYQAAPPVIESKLESQAETVSGYSVNGGTVYMYYKDRDAVSAATNDHAWSFTTEPLQSGAQVQLYADVDGMTPSYFTSAIVKYPGSGTEDDPYRIYTAEDLQGASNSGYYKLMNDIDLTSWIAENSPTKGWPAIGRNSTVATYIDGDGHKVSGLWTNTTDNYTGLFSNYSAGCIKNLNVEVAAGKKVKGGDYTGVLIGRMANGEIVNCTVKGEVEGAAHVGGISGYIGNSSLSVNSFSGKVSSASSNAYVGGVAGYITNSTLNADIFDGSINAACSGGYVGGLAGYTNTTAITACNASATIASTQAASCVAGLVGKAVGGSIEKSYVTETTVTSEAQYAGGLVGYSSSPITTSYSAGSVTTTGEDAYAGGLAGYTTSAVSNCYSTVAIEGTQFTGGLVGYSFSTIDKCYAMGNVKGSMYGAGLVGELDGSSASARNSVAINNKLDLTAQSSWGCRVIGGFKNGCAEPTLGSNLALNTMQVSLNGVAQKKTDDNIEGVAKTEAELKSSATYAALGWDFEKTWAIDEGKMYPYLLWEVDSNPVVQVTFDKTTAVVAMGNTLTLTANVLPISATNKRLTWSTNKPGVATVEDGVVTAVAIGEATITATATDGSGVSAQCKVTVVANHDEAINQLRDDVDAALALYNNSTEGSNIGQYAAGSRAALLKVINEVRALITDTMDETDISNCSSKLAKAVADFKAQQVTGGADTDITLLDNVIYIEPVQSGTGRQLTLSVKMKNTKAFTGYKFDLYLPEGCTFATDEDGFPLAALSLERTTTAKTNYFDSSILGGGEFLRVLCYSSKGYAFTGEDGEIATVTIDIPADMEAGDYALVLKDIELAVGDESYDTDYVKSTLTVTTYKLGDANDDGKIGVADLTAIASHILGTTPARFVQAAADANEDGKIGVADLTCIAGWILNGTASNRRAPAAASMEGMSVELADFTIVPGGTAVVPVSISNGACLFSGYQFDVCLPEGFRVVSASLADDRLGAAAQTFDTALTSETNARVLCYSLKNTAFFGNAGVVAYLTIAADSNVATGLYSTALEGAELSYYATSMTPDVQSGSIRVALPTEISSIESVMGADAVYDINGRRVNAATLAKGLYIMNGKKIVK